MTKDQSKVIKEKVEKQMVNYTTNYEDSYMLQNTNINSFIDNLFKYTHMHEFKDNEVSVTYKNNETYIGKTIDAKVMITLKNNKLKCCSLEELKLRLQKIKDKKFHISIHDLQDFRVYIIPLPFVSESEEEESLVIRFEYCDQRLFNAYMVDECSPYKTF